MRLGLAGLLVAILFSLTGCTSADTYSEAAIDKYNNVTWILGNWDNYQQQLDRKFVQNWKKSGKHQMKGIFKVTEGGKETFFENLTIKLKGDDLIYIVDGPKIKKPIHFKLTESNFRHFKLENPENDYPKIIEYESKDQKSRMITRTLGGGQRIDYQFFKGE